MFLTGGTLVSVQGRQARLVLAGPREVPQLRGGGRGGRAHGRRRPEDEHHERHRHPQGARPQGDQEEEGQTGSVMSISIDMFADVEVGDDDYVKPAN